MDFATIHSETQLEQQIPAALWPGLLGVSDFVPHEKAINPRPVQNK